MNEDNDTPEDGAALLNDVRAWLARYIGVVREDDLDLLTLWAAHTWLVEVTYTTPRLEITSPVHESGKTTVLEHLFRLCLDPVQMSNLSSPALITRMLAERPRTVLIDEADRALNPKNEGIGEVIAVLNSGYKVGATRPTLVPHKEDGWRAQELPTYSPVVMAGNNPQLPDDTRSRCIPVHLAPSDEVEESDWESLDSQARELGARLGKWSRSALEAARAMPTLPDVVKGRSKERWRPLKRVAVAAGGDWPGVADHLAVEDVQRIETEKDEGIMQERPHIALLKHLAAIWPAGETFVESKELLEKLVWTYPEMWGEESTFDKPLTHQRMGRMLSRNFGLQSVRPHTHQPRGYSRGKLDPLWSRMGIPLPEKADKPAEPAEPDSPRIQITGKASLSGSPEGVSRNGYEADIKHLHQLTPIPRSTEEIEYATGWDRQRAGRAAFNLSKSQQEVAA